MFDLYLNIIDGQEPTNYPFSRQNDFLFRRSGA